MKRLTIYVFVCLLSIGSLLAQQVEAPASKQTQTYSIKGATAHLGNGKVIENSLIKFSNGKLTFVGSANGASAEGVVINAEGKHVYPGFIAVNTSLGLVEIDAVKASADAEEIGSVNPHIRSIIAYNAESKVVETMRPNGVLIAQVTPRGGVVSGTSSIVQLDAWNWEDAIVKEDDAIHMNWPRSVSFSGRWWAGEPRVAKTSTSYPERLEEFTSYLRKAKAYKNNSSGKTNLPLKAMTGLFDGSKKLFIHVDGEREIRDAVALCKKEGVQKIVIVLGNDAHKAADILVKYDIPVVLRRAHRLPSSQDEDVDLPYRSAKILTDKGVTVGIGMQGDMERMSTRNMPFYAGTYGAYGLGKEEAVKLITSNAAKILGIDDTTGTLEVGKDATLFVSKGDALDMRTNIISDAFIQGRKISLETNQTKMWKRYSNKYKNN